jgi:hypothetical protein
VRHDVVFTDNVSDTANADVRGSVMRFFNYDNVVVSNNVQPTPSNRRQAMVDAVRSCNVVAEKNDLGDDLRQLQVDSPRTNCLAAAAKSAGAIPPPAPTVFDGQRLAIDAGNASAGAVTCAAAEDCNGYLTELGPRAKVVTANAPDLAMADRTILMGNMQFSIPIRNGTYRVTMSFVEPAFHSAGKRRFNVDSENQRMLLAFDPYDRAGGIDKRVHRGFDVTVGDGTLNIRFGGGSVPAIVSYITIVRA